MIFHTEDREYRINESSVVFISNLERHSIVSEGDVYERYVVSIVPREAARVTTSDLLLSPFTYRPSDFSNVSAVGGITERLDILFGILYDEYTNTDGEFENVVATLLKNILINIHRCVPNAFLYRNTSISDMVQDIKRRLERDLESDISFSDIDADSHIRRYYLSHVFK